MTDNLVAKDYEYVRDYRTRYLYGMSLESVRQIWIDQQGCCAICLTPLNDPARSVKQAKAHIDHSHKTNKVRGILCIACNVGLGLFKDDVELLAIAIDYLEDNE